MKFTFKKLTLIIIISASIPLLVSNRNLIFESLFLATSNLDTQYSTQVKDKLNTINKNKNDIEELSLEINSKKNDLSMESNNIGYDESKIVSTEADELKLDEKNMSNLLFQFDGIKTDIKKHKENKDYSTLLSDMNSLISFQKNKYDLLQKVDLDLDTALGVLN